MTTTLDDHPHPHLDIRWERSDFAGHLAAEAIECHATPRYRIRPSEVPGVVVCGVLVNAANSVLQLGEREGVIDESL